MDITIVNVGYHSTNCWVVSARRSRLLIDIGWPQTMGLMRANLRRTDVPLDEIRYALATHYHIDHAGLAEELKQAGVPLLVAETQLDAIRRLNDWAETKEGFIRISEHDSVVVGFGESRGLLASIGIAGELLPTPGHSADSVSLLLDDGSAFTGDLGPPLSNDPADPTLRSWRLLHERGMAHVYPGHGRAHQAPRLEHIEGGRWPRAWDRVSKLLPREHQPRDQRRRPRSHPKPGISCGTCRR